MQPSQLKIERNFFIGQSLVARQLRLRVRRLIDCCVQGRPQSDSVSACSSDRSSIFWENEEAFWCAPELFEY